MSIFFDIHRCTLNLLELQYNFAVCGTQLLMLLCLNRPKAGVHNICRCCKMLIISINLLVQNYQHLTTSAYALLCLCVSEKQPLVITAANHLDTACTSLLEMCRHCRAETIKIGQGTVVLNWEIVVPCLVRTKSYGKWNDCYKYNSLHLLRKYARIFVSGHYLFWHANSFPRALRNTSCSRTTIRAYYHAKWRL